ncbi:MAG: hypothetical protein NC453_17995 [Muribaculum sp.]|nr:hypothetical protein [Muribaculum sp.]
MAKMKKRTGISEKVRRLKIGDAITVPCEDRNTLLCIAARTRKAMVRIGWNYEISDDMTNFTTSIRRTQ